MILAVSYTGPSGRAIGSLTVTTDSRVFTLTSDHPEFQEILDLLKAQRNAEAEVRLDRATAVRAAVANTAFTINGNVVSFGGRDLPTVMAQYIIRLKDEGFNLAPLEKFTENLYQNPSYRAIQEAFRFIEANEMPITDDGCFIGYRAVTSDYKDIRTRTFDNSVGAICKEDRNLVDEDPDQTCSKGLHVCSLSYINGAGAGYGNSNSPWVIVKVNPRDVVAVPRDYKNTKLRCCEFEVVGELDKSKIKPEDKKSYRETAVVFKETDAELVKAGKFYELGQKHAKNNAARGGGDPLTSLSFTSNTSHELYMAGYEGRQRPTAVMTPATKAAPAAVPGTNAGIALAMYNAGRYADLMAFKKEKRVSFERLGFNGCEIHWIEKNRNNNCLVGTAAPVAVPVYTDSLGFEVSAPLVFNASGYDQFGFRRTGKNRKGLTRAAYATTPAPTIPQQVVTNVTNAADTQMRQVSSKFDAGYRDGQNATAFLPVSTGQDYWNGFTAAWKLNPHNTNK